MVTVASMLRELASPPVASRAAGSGFQRLDEMTDGLVAGRLHLITGWPGHGRSTLLSQWAVTLADAGLSTELLCPAEGLRSVGERLVAAGARVPRGPDLRSRLESRRRRVSRLASLPLRITTCEDLTPGDLTRAISDTHAGAVLLDDVDLMSDASPAVLSALSRRGVLVIAVLPRQTVVRDLPAPHIDRDWGSAADVIVEVRMAGWPGRDDLRPGEADLLVLRNRAGPTGVVPVVFHGHHARFVDLAPA
jgi:replicative DNA helicase